jgi:hypothetical protein
VLRRSGAVISVVTKVRQRESQWVGFNDYRPKRSIGVTTRTEPNMTTIVDEPSTTLKHIRLLSSSSGGDFQWAWDFYVTHATLTVTKAQAPFGFTYRGTPGGALDEGDRLVSSAGLAQLAVDSFYQDLTGPAEWLYLADTALGQSIFFVQHWDDAERDRYDAKDGDSSTWTFGDGKLGRPGRFSFGLVDSTTHAAVQARASFVAAALGAP